MADGVNEYTMKWRGDRSAKHDYFDEIMEAPQTPGNVFSDSEGLREYDRVREHIAEDGSGLAITYPCRRCRCQGKIIVPWDELFAISAYPLTGRVPKGYALSNRPENEGALYPTTCPCACGAPLAPLIKPNEAYQLLDGLMRSKQHGVEDALNRSPLATQVRQMIQLSQRGGR